MYNIYDKINKPTIFFMYVLFFSCLLVLNPANSVSATDKHEVMYFPAGIHRLAEIESDADFLAIRGDGSGITVLEIPGGITLTGKEPRLSGFTLKGYKNRKTGITLKNNHRVLIQDVEVQGYELGLLSQCDYGERQWLHVYRDLYIYEGPGGGMRSYDPKIKGIELRYMGEKSKKGGWKEGGGFSNTHTFYGGRIAVPGTPLFIDGPTATTMFGTYIDMSDAPVHMTSRSAGLQLFGVHLDRNRRARLKKMPAIILENPKFNRLRVLGEHVGLMKQGLIVDGDKKTVDSKYIHIEKY